MSIFSERLKELRKKRGYTQSELAKYMNMRQGSYTKWETGMTEPRIESLIKLADILDTTTDFLLGKTNIDFGNDSKVYEEYKELLSQNKKEEIKERYDHSFEFFINAVAKQLNISVEEALDKIIQNIGNNLETTETK
jgi:transcriptional regulator, cro/CI family